MNYFHHQERYRYYEMEYLNQCQEDKYELIYLREIKVNNSEVKRLLVIFVIGLFLVSFPGIAWSGVETYFNINYVDHKISDGSPIILNNNPNAVDPTYEELITFLKNDQNDQTEYNLHPFLRAQKLHDKAEKAGYKCSWVLVKLEGGKEQACNAFNTIDRGIVFVDHTTWNNVEDFSSFVSINVGGQYIPRNMLYGSIRYNPLGTIEDYKIYW